MSDILILLSHPCQITVIHDIKSPFMLITAYYDKSYISMDYSNPNYGIKSVYYDK